MKAYFQLIPEKVLSEQDVINEILKPIIKGFCPDNLNEVISILACHSRDNNEPTPLKIEYIKKMVPQGDKYLSALIDLGIILRSGRFIPGQTAYKYSFAPEYYGKFASFPLKNTKLIRRIELAIPELKKPGKQSARGKSDQIPFLEKLRIDGGYKSSMNQFADKPDKYNAILSQVTLIENGQIFYTVDSTSGRFHSNVTNLKSELRPYLRINGEPLVNIDIKNSQPYLSTIILTDPSKVSWMTTDPAFALLLQTLKVTMKEDVKKYISLVVSGEIYEYLMEAFAEDGLILNRSETKLQVLRILFSRNRNPSDPINALARTIFIEHFPTVHRIFSKVRGNNGGDKFNNFKRFAILLQKIEAYLMLDVILKRIYRELPGTIAVTVHDSIMTGILTNRVEEVKDIISEELQNFVGFAPRLSIKNEVEKKVNSKSLLKEGEKEEGKGESITITNTMLQPLQHSVEQ